MARCEITVIAEMDDELIQEWIQYVRDFDTKLFPGRCHFKMLAKADGKTLEEMEAIFSAIDPPFERQETFKKQ